MKIIHQIKETLSAIVPFDKKEEEHLHFAKEWVNSGVGIFRIIKPATPDPHLVAYFLLLDPVQGMVLLVDHKKVGLWLPAGGHVELDEHPEETVKREVFEMCLVVYLELRFMDLSMWIAFGLLFLCVTRDGDLSL